MIEIAPGTTRIGWIGTGVMGRSMCGHLITAGYEVAVHTRTPARAADLLAAGARWAASPAAAADGADVVMVMVGFPDDVREVVLGESGTFASARRGSIAVDFTTSDPSLA